MDDLNEELARLSFGSVIERWQRGSQRAFEGYEIIHRVGKRRKARCRHGHLMDRPIVEPGGVLRCRTCRRGDPKNCPHCGRPKARRRGARTCGDPVCRAVPAPRASLSGPCPRCGRPKPARRGARWCGLPGCRPPCQRCGVKGSCFECLLGEARRRRKRRPQAPCRRCGAPRPRLPGRRPQLCDACRALPAPSHVRDPSHKAPSGPCPACGGPKPRGRGRKLCDACRAAGARWRA